MVAKKLLINLENDRMESFEKYVIGGVFDANLDETINYRSSWSAKFRNIDIHDGCRILWPERGVPNNCKTVFVFDNHEDKKFFQTFLGTIGLHILEDILFQKGIMAWKMRER